MAEVIIYNRTSTEDQNPENQLKDCLSINNFGEYEVISDQQSAWKDEKEREGFEKLKRLIKDKKITHLIVWDFDRIYRNRLKFKEFLQFLNAYSIKLHSYRQQWFEDLHKIPSPWNDIVYDLMTNIYGHIAEEESKKKSERVRAAIRLGADGKPMSHKGNKWGRRDIPESASKRIIELYNQGKSLREIKNEVFYWDSNNNKRFVGLGTVHKTISKFRQENPSFNAPSSNDQLPNA